MVLEKDVKQFTKSKLLCLISSQSESSQRALLANLRRGIGKSPGDDPKLWGSFLCDMPQEMFGMPNKPSKAEWAVYTVLTLFALHQQGKDPISDCMHVENRSFGDAMARLAAGSEDDLDRVTQRFNMVATSTDMREMAYHLRGVVQLLRSNEIPLDYVDLAGDLFLFQISDKKQSIRLKWGQEFYAAINKQNKLKGEKKQDE